MRELRRRIRLFAQRCDGMLVYEGKLSTAVAEAAHDRNFQRLSLPNVSAASGKALAHQEDSVCDLNGLFGTSVAFVFGASGEPPARRLQ
jgi:hypothetical protein